MNRRSLLVSAAGAGLAVSGLAAPYGLGAGSATDDELAFASFGPPAVDVETASAAIEAYLG